MKILTTAAAAAALVLQAAGASAQVADTKTVTLEGAHRVLAAAALEARKDNSAGALAVVDSGGSVVALERLDGTFAAAAEVSVGKARTAALFKKPTRFFEDVIAKGRTSMVALEHFTPLRGGVPLVVDGQVVGAVGVSGATSADRDDEIAVAAAAALGGAAPAALPPVSFFDHADVAASFARGAVLFAGDKYMVHTSRREGPGMAEVHAQDADIIYVLDGAATLVTGGTVVEPKETAPGEIRGREIAGGQPRAVTRGDVIVVPAGTPHWFRDVPGPITYYTVKSR